MTIQEPIPLAPQGMLELILTSLSLLRDFVTKKLVLLILTQQKYQRRDVLPQDASKRFLIQQLILNLFILQNRGLHEYIEVFNLSYLTNASVDIKFEF